MSEFTEAVKQRYMKPKNSEVQDKINKQQVKGVILSLCETYLETSEDVLTFESLKGELQYVIEAINEEPLKSRFIINQVSETLFEARLIEIDIGLSN